MKPNQQSEASLHALDYWQVIRNRYGVILLSFFLVFLTAAIVTWIMPRKYPGTVLIQVERLSGSATSLDDPAAERRNISEGMYFLPTEFKVITSKETLNIVIDKLGLVERWKLNTREEAYQKLLGMVDASEERGTSLIKIEVLSTDREEAAEIANEVAEAYRNRRTQMENERVQTAFQTITRTLEAQSKAVRDAQARMLELVQRYGIVDHNITNPFAYYAAPETNTGVTSLYQASREMQLRKEAEIADYQSQLDAIKDKEGEALISAAAAINLTDPKIQSTYSQYLQAQAEFQGLLKAGYGRRHPLVQRVATTIEEYKKQLDDGIKNLREVLEDRIKTARDVLENIKNIAEGKKEESIDDRGKYQEYQLAKDEFNRQKQVFDQMTAEMEKTRVATLMPRTPAVIHERAVVADRFTKPNVPLQLGLGAILGLVLGVGFAFFLEYLDTSVKTLDDVERYLGVPVLAVIPKDVGVLHKQSGISPDAEAYRILRTNIEFNRKSSDANAITIVSGGAGEGKSTTLVNLAYICAQGGYNTLMIDGDLRRPKLHTFFDINNSVGLTNYLTTDLQLEDVILQTPIDNLYFMPSGILPADAAGILNSRRMSELIADVKNRFDLVLIDSPPILGVSDASVLASEVDLTMIVIQHRKLPRSMLLRVKQAIENVGGNLLGVVLNNVDVRSDSQYQYYTSYYTYYAPTNVDPKKNRPKKSDDKSTAGSGKSQSVASVSSGDDEY